MSTWFTTSWNSFYENIWFCGQIFATFFSDDLCYGEGKTFLPFLGYENEVYFPLVGVFELPFLPPLLSLTSWSPSLEVWDHQRDVMCSVTTCSSYHWSLFTVQYCHFWMFYKAKAHNSDFAFRLLSSDLISVGPGPMSKLCSIYLGLRFKTGFLKHEQLLSDAQQKLWWLISSMTYGFTAAAKTASHRRLLNIV